MRIAMLVPRPHVRGPIPKLTLSLADALRRTGCTVELLPWGRRAEAESLSRKVFGRVQDVIRARQVVSRKGFDLVVVHTAHDWSTLVRDLVLVRMLRSRSTVVVEFHGSQSGRLVRSGSSAFKRVSAALAGSVDGLLVLSSQERDEWRRFGVNAPVHVVRNPGPQPVMTLAVARNNERPTILCVARVMAEKGVFDLVRALPQVMARTPCRLVVAGDGPDASRTHLLAAELGVEEFVELPGYLESEELERFYGEADVFALPTYWYEGFPTVILEAMAAGLPIVTTRSRGPADHLVEGRNALFVPANDPKALAGALSRVLADAELRRKMAVANQEKAREFEPGLVAAHYLAALESIISRPTRSRRQVSLPTD